MMETICTLTNLFEALRKVIPGQEENRKVFLEKLLKILSNIGSTQLRNAITFGYSIHEMVEARCIMKTLGEVKGKEDNMMID
jgi:hypothetical protein